jgi:hypothetical protein
MLSNLALNEVTPDHQTPRKTGRIKPRLHRAHAHRLVRLWGISKHGTACTRTTNYLPINDNISGDSVSHSRRLHTGSVSLLEWRTRGRSMISSSHIPPRFRLTAGKCPWSSWNHVHYYIWFRLDDFAGSYEGPKGHVESVRFHGPVLTSPHHTA